MDIDFLELDMRKIKNFNFYNIYKNWIKLEDYAGNHHSFHSTVTVLGT